MGRDVDIHLSIFHHAGQMTAPNLTAAAPYQHAVALTEALLTALKMDHSFVSGVALSAWTGVELADGAVDVLAVLAPERKAQIPMMAMNRGFTVDRDAVEATAELDLVPLAVEHENGRVRVHVLVASNALYAHMVNRSVAAAFDQSEIRVVSAEDLALMLIVGREDALGEVRRLREAAAGQFDLVTLNDRLVSLGLEKRIITD